MLGLTQTSDMWQPIADAALAERLQAAIQDVAEALRDPTPTSDLGPEPAGLARGDASLALFYTYLSRAAPDDGWQDVAQAYLDRAIERVATTTMDPSLYSGFSGVAWVLEHLCGKEVDPDGDDLNQAVDEALEGLLAATPWRLPYDLIGGLIGYGAYALERLPRPSAARCLERVIARLDEIATRIGADGGEQITWWTDPAGLPDETARAHPEGYFNLGVAHGVPGAIPILAGACRAGIAVGRAGPLLDGAMRWLQANRLPDGSAGRFEYTLPSVRGGGQGKPARAAWCYGDPGVAAALLAGARAVDNEVWEREAIELALLAARRPTGEAQIVDMGICHGASGLAHIFNRLYHETGEPALADAARRWLERTLELRQPDLPIVGFPAYRPDREPAWDPDPGLLTGAAGVAMVMISAVAPIVPAWDRVLACSLPPI